MGGGRDLDPVNRLDGNVERGIDSDCDLGSAQVVVDRRGNTNHWETLLKECEGTGLRSVPAYDDDCIDMALVQDADGP